jgi:alkylhydroperoxidase family enzyme
MPWKDMFGNADSNAGCWSLSSCVLRRSMAARTAWTCIRKTRERMETRSRGCTPLWFGERPLFFTERERAALAWTEAVTLVSQEQVPDNVFEIARKEFSDKELVNLTMAVIAINGWNRVAISFREVAGTYQPAPPQGGAKEA